MRKKVLNVFRYVFLSIVSFISVFPFFWMIVAATNKSVEVTKGTMIPGTYFFVLLSYKWNEYPRKR